MYVAGDEVLFLNTSESNESRGTNNIDEWTRKVNHRWRGDGDEGGGEGGKATSAYIDTRLLSAVTFTRATPRPSLAFPARKTGSKVGKHECATSCLCNAAALSAYS